MMTPNSGMSTDACHQSEEAAPVKVSIKKKLSAEQWGMARVYAFANKLTGPEKLNHDTDLVKKK